jgi:antitoxin (DNA-binding transcriptional repressor) of toxin-antitoxin stability system
VAEQIPTSALNRRSGDIITRASLGESFELVRHGRIVARLLPPLEDGAGEVVGIPTSATGGSYATSSNVTQADPHIAVSPQLRPTNETEPVKAQTKQQKVDDLLRGARRGR